MLCACVGISIRMDYAYEHNRFSFSCFSLFLLHRLLLESNLSAVPNIFLFIHRFFSVKISNLVLFFLKKNLMTFDLDDVCNQTHFSSRFSMIFWGFGIKENSITQLNFYKLMNITQHNTTQHLKVRVKIKMEGK